MTEIAGGVLIQYATKNEIRDLIAEGVHKYGDKVNPRSERPGTNTCVYSKQDPEEHESPMCIIGYVAMRMGWDIPNEDVIQGAGSVARALGWPVDEATCNWMDSIQSIFDGIRTGKSPDTERTWEQAYAICVENHWNPEEL